MRNCNNCGGPPSIHHNGCDYCGTNVPIKRHVSYVDVGNMPRSKAQKLLEDFWVPAERVSVDRVDYTFNPRDWGHYDPACNWWRTPCGADVEIVRHYIERYGEEAPRAWQNDLKTDWPRRIR